MNYDKKIQVRVDGNLKKQAEKVYDQLGVDLGTAVRIFLQQSVIQNGFPFGMMALDGLKGACTNRVSREKLISEGRAWEVQRTERTCRMAGANQVKKIEHVETVAQPVEG